MENFDVSNRGLPEIKTSWGAGCGWCAAAKVAASLKDTIRGRKSICSVQVESKGKHRPPPRYADVAHSCNCTPALSSQPRESLPAPSLPCYWCRGYTMCSPLHCKVKSAKSTFRVSVCSLWSQETTTLVAKIDSNKVGINNRINRILCSSYSCSYPISEKRKHNEGPGYLSRLLDSWVVRIWLKTAGCASELFLIGWGLLTDIWAKEWAAKFIWQQEMQVCSWRGTGE